MEQLPHIHVVRCVCARLLSVLSCMVLMIPIFCGAQEWEEPTRPSRRQEFQQILSRLDLGGDLLFVAHTRGMADALFERLSPEGLPLDHPEAQAIKARIDAIDTFLQKHGFYAVHGVGVSSVPDPRGDHTTRVFMLRDYVDSNLPLWRGLVGWQPRRMSSLDFLPPSTEMIKATTAEFGQLWRVLRAGVTESGSETAVAELDVLESKLAAVLGSRVDTLIDNLRDETLFSVQLSGDAKAAIPTRGGVVTIPEPAFLVCLAQSDPALRAMIEAQFALRGFGWRESRVGDVSVRTLSTPLPAPFPLQPSIATVSGYLLISSTEANLREALTAYRHRSGLLSRPHFKQAVRGIDLVNNAFSYRSQAAADALNTMRDASRSTPLVSGEHPAAARIADQALAPAPLGAHAVAVFNWKSGIMVVGNHVDGGRTVLERFSAVPLARLLAPERRAGWMKAGHALLDLLALPTGGVSPSATDED